MTLELEPYEAKAALSKETTHNKYSLVTLLSFESRVLHICTGQVAVIVEISLWVVEIQYRNIQLTLLDTPGLTPLHVID